MIGPPAGTSGVQRAASAASMPSAMPMHQTSRSASLMHAPASGPAVVVICLTALVLVLCCPRVSARVGAAPASGHLGAHAGHHSRPADRLHTITAVGRRRLVGQACGQRPHLALQPVSQTAALVKLARRDDCVREAARQGDADQTQPMFRMTPDLEPVSRILRGWRSTGWRWRRSRLGARPSVRHSLLGIGKARARLVLNLVHPPARAVLVEHRLGC